MTADESTREPGLEEALSRHAARPVVAYRCPECRWYWPGDTGSAQTIHDAQPRQPKCRARVRALVEAE